MCTQTTPIPCEPLSTGSANPQSPPLFTAVVVEQGLQKKDRELTPPQLNMKKESVPTAKRKQGDLLLTSSAGSVIPTPNNDGVVEDNPVTKRRKFLSRKIQLAGQTGGRKTVTIFPILKKPTDERTTNSSDSVGTNSSMRKNKYSLFSKIKGKKPRVSFAKSTKAHTAQKKSPNGSYTTPSKYDTRRMTLKDLTSNLRNGEYTIERQRKLLEVVKKAADEHEQQKQRLLAIQSETKVTAQEVVQNRLDKFKMMCKALKIYIEAERALQCADDYLSSSTLNTTELRERRKEYARHLHDSVLRSISRFQHDTSSRMINENNSQLTGRKCEKPLIDYNITFSGKFGRVSLLHVAVLLYDENLIKYLLKSGIKHIRETPSTDLAIDLFKKARERNDEKMAGSYTFIYKMLKQKTL